MAAAADSWTELWAAYEAERPIYERLAGHVGRMLARALEETGIPTTVTARAKETESFVTKALLKGYDDPMSEIGDKAGVRVTVVYSEDVPEVEATVRGLMPVINSEQKLDALAYNQAGYLGVHLDTVLRAEDAQAVDPSFVGRRVEIQIRTMVQSAWAEVSHEQLYKPAADVPDRLKRQIYRLVSLVELFDLEVERFLADARSTPGFAEAQALRPLTQELLRRFDVRRRPDRQLSLVMAARLVPLYESPPADVYPRFLQPWIHENEPALRVHFDEAHALPLNPLARQPEVFIIFERLANDPRRLEAAWPDVVPRAWLVELAGAWGTPVGE